MKLTLTEVAATEVRKLIDVDNECLRISVAPGGCSGFKYDFLIVSNVEEEDTICESFGIDLVVDPFSASYLDGTEIDYKKSLQESGFTFNNPNSTGGCGCGKSFGT
jgi:iron-sulfur cluster assembly accessory protein